MRKELIREKLLKPSELEKETGVLASTIRYWIREGILEPDYKTKGGFYLFKRDAIEKIKAIREMQELGLTLEEIKELIELEKKGTFASFSPSFSLDEILKISKEDKLEETIEAMLNPLTESLGKLGEKIKKIFAKRISIVLENFIKAVVITLIPENKENIDWSKPLSEIVKELEIISEGGKK